MAAGLSVPGDPDALEQLGARLRYAAQGVGSLGSNTRQFTAGTVADAEWTGAAANSFSAFGANLGDGAGGAEGPLARMASAVETYAGYLRTAQQKAQQFNFIANGAANDPTGAVMSAAEHAGQSATEAISAAQRAGDQAAAEVTTASGQLQSLFGNGPVQRFILAQPRLSVEPPLLPGAEILGNPGAGEFDLGPEILRPGPWLGLLEGTPVPPELGLIDGDPIPTALGPEILGNPGGGLFGPLTNLTTPSEPGDEPGTGDDPEPQGEGVVDPRDVHGEDRTGSRGIDVPYVKEHGELFYQDDGQLVRVLDNGNGTSDIVIYDPSNPSGQQTTTIRLSDSEVQSRLNSGRWFE